MTVRLLLDYYGQPANSLITRSAAEEQDLIDANMASATLTGGTTYTAPTPQTQYEPAQLSTDANGNTVLVGADGVPIRYKRIKAAPKLLRKMDNPLASLALMTPVYAVGIGDKIFAVCGGSTDAGYSFVYDWTTREMSRSSAQICGGAIEAGSINGLWASSTHLFVAMRNSGVLQAKIYRSAITDGLTWTEVFDFATDLPNVHTSGGYQLKQMCECSDGTLLAACYNSTAAAGNTFSKALLRSTDSGVTWTDVEPNLATRAYRHVHFVVWDKYRSLVWVGVGDEGDKAQISVSSDFGVTWEGVPSSFQVTGIIPLPNSIIYLSDREISGSKEAGIWRLDGATKDELFKATAYNVFDPIKDGGLGYADPAAAGFAWWGWYNEDNGVMYAPYVETAGATGIYAALVASGDGGTTWDVIATEYNSSAPAAFVTQNQTSRPSDYADWDGWHYLAGGGTFTAPWMVHAADQDLQVANSTGYINGTGSASRPMKEIPHIYREIKQTYTSMFHLPRRFKLTENYADALHQSTDQVVIDRNGFSFAGSAVGALHTDEGFEGTGTPSGWASTVNVGTLDYDSVAQAHSGSQSAKCLVASGAVTGAYAWAQRNVTALTDDMVRTYEAWFYVDVPAASFITGNFSIIKTHGALRCTLYGAAVPYLQVTHGALSFVGYLRANDRVAFPMQSWNKVTLRIRKDNGGGAYPYAGGVELWLNDVKLVSIPGGGRSSNVASESLVYFGVGDRSTAFAYDIPVYVDDVKIVDTAIPAQSAGLVLAGAAQALI